ncbi:MAG: glycosyltransferase [Anaerolineales bacterium]|nr:glycosyltransferase [Anaerolineales bacterium]
MRVGMMADAYKPHVSGITNYISLNQRALQAAGHDVFVFTFGDAALGAEDPTVLRSPGLPLAHTGYHLSLRHTRQVRRMIQSMDIVHVHHPFLSGGLGLRYCRPAGIPVVFTNHTRYDLYAQYYLPALPDRIRTGLLQAYLPFFCSEVDLTIAPSQGLRGVLRELGVASPVKVIPNGIDLAPFCVPRDPLHRARLGIPDEALLLVYTGRLGPEKNLGTLLRAFAGVREAVAAVGLLMVGDGPERGKLELMAQKLGIGGWVFFAGMVDYARVPGYLAASDVCVTASVTEVHPLSIIEALACGLPAVGIDSPGVSDTIQDEVNGLLSRQDLAAFTAQLTRIVVDPELRQRLAGGALRSAQAFDISRTSRLVLDEYQRLIAAPRKRRDPAWRQFTNRLRSAIH